MQSFPYVYTHTYNMYIYIYVCIYIYIFIQMVLYLLRTGSAQGPFVSYSLTWLFCPKSLFFFCFSWHNSCKLPGDSCPRYFYRRRIVLGLSFRKSDFPSTMFRLARYLLLVGRKAFPARTLVMLGVPTTLIHGPATFAFRVAENSTLY